MKYLRTDEQTYEAIRAAVDSANGWPDDGTITAFDPAAVAPKDADGQVLLAAGDWLLGAASELLAQMEEVEAVEYTAAVMRGAVADQT